MLRAGLRADGVFGAPSEGGTACTAGCCQGIAVWIRAGWLCCLLFVLSRYSGLSGRNVFSSVFVGAVFPPSVCEDQVLNMWSSARKHMGPENLRCFKDCNFY